MLENLAPSNPSTDSLNEKLLAKAWELFNLYDSYASRTQKRFLQLRAWILGLGVTAGILGILEEILKSSVKESSKNSQGLCQLSNWLCRNWPIPGYEPSVDVILTSLHFLVIILPIMVTILLAGSLKFDRGTSWVILRASAESIKAEIFRYLCRVDKYKNKKIRDGNFANELQKISERLMKTQVNQMGIYTKPPSLPSKKKNRCLVIIKKETRKIRRRVLSPVKKLLGIQSKPRKSLPRIKTSLTPDAYIENRLLDQSKFYRSRIQKIYKQIQKLYWCVYILGGVSTFLSAIGWSAWIAVTTSISTAIMTYIAIRQLDNTLINYNQAATNLDNLLLWWESLSSEEKKVDSNFDKLVNNTENILGAEVSGWVQEMQNALADLYKENREEIEKQSPEKHREINRETVDKKDGVDSDAVVSTVSERSTSGENPDNTGKETGTSEGESDRSPDNENSTDTKPESS